MSEQIPQDPERQEGGGVESLEGGDEDAPADETDEPPDG